MQKGQRITEETRIRMQAAAKKRGNNRGSGWKLSEEHKQKISKANKEAYKDYWKTHKHPLLGKKLSIEERKRISERQMGRIPWNKGLTKTDPRVALNGRLAGLTRMGNPGPVISEEGKEKLRQLHLGSKNPQWKGGITSQGELLRGKFYRTIRKQVLERDNYTCIMCKSQRNLHVDHIIEWQKHVELRFSIDNCRTLCARCHYKITFGKEIPENVTHWGYRLEVK